MEWWNGALAAIPCTTQHNACRKLVTVVLETKQEFSINSLAQLLEYYFRAATSYKAMGVCLLLTRQSLHCVLCPFEDENGTLINALCLREIKFKDMNSMLYMLAIVTSSYFGRQSLICLEERFLPLRKDLQFFVECDQTKNLEDRVTYLKAHVKKLEKEVAELKCKYFPVQLKVTHKDFA